MSPREATERGDSDGKDYWEEAPTFKADFRDHEYLRHKSSGLGYVTGKAVTDSSWVHQDTDTLECDSCQFELEVQDQRWFGKIITATTRWGSDETGWNEAPKVNNTWAWQLICPCCEQTVVIAETTQDDANPNTIKETYAGDDGIMSEESLEVSLERVMNG